MAKMGSEMICEHCKVTCIRRSGNQRYCLDCNLIKNKGWVDESNKKRASKNEPSRDKVSR